MRSRANASTSLVLIFVALASLVSMVSTVEINGIIEGLWRYGLQYSLQWEDQLFTLTAVVMGTGLLIIIVSIVLQLYLFMGRRGEISKSEVSTSLEQPVKDEAPEAERKSVEKAAEKKAETTALALKTPLCLDEIGVLLQQKPLVETTDQTSAEQDERVKEKRESEPNSQGS